MSCWYYFLIQTFLRTYPAQWRKLCSYKFKLLRRNLLYFLGLTKLLLENKVKYVHVRNCRTYTSMISLLLLINNILENKSKCFSWRKFIWLKMLKDLFLNIFWNPNNYCSFGSETKIVMYYVNGHFTSN